MTYILQPVGKNYDMVIFDGDVVQGTWAIVINNSKILNCMYANIASHADADEFTVPLVLGKGTYDLHLVYSKDSDQGKLDVLIDSTVVINQLDTYDAATQHNEVHEESNVAIGGGLHTLHFLVNGKNAASSNHIMRLQMISFRKVA